MSRPTEPDDRKQRRPSLRAGLAARVLAAAAMLAAAAPAVADPLPVALQAAFLRKVLLYDTQLRSDEPRAVVVYASSGAPAAAELVEALQKRGVAAQAVAEAALAQGAATTRVAYVLPQAATPELLATCARLGVLTIAGDAALAESGRASVAFGVKADGKPEIVVNLTRLRLEQHEFSAELLGLARVIR